MKKTERTKKLYAEVVDKEKITIVRTGLAIEIFIDGHPLVDVSLITKRVFLYTSLKSHDRQFVTVANECAYVAPMWDEHYIQP